jgi:hypothetical protein
MKAPRRPIMQNDFQTSDKLEFYHQCNQRMNVLQIPLLDQEIAHGFGHE